MGTRTAVCALLALALAACGGAGDFSPTGSMGVPRHGHTATRLASGEILLTAGLTKTSPLASLETYHPRAGVFRSHEAAGLRARGWHKATLLEGGVLITGGWAEGGEALRDSLLIPTGGGAPSRVLMKHPRYDHTATRLTGGAVLIAGGNDGKRAVRHLEIYAAGEGRFTPAQRPMLVARQQHTATTLAGGAVLLVGGAEGAAARYAEQYIPSRGRTRLVRSLTTQRSRHTATRLRDGRVLITGGLGRERTLDSAEVFDPKTETFLPLQGNLRVRRQQHTATLLADGRVVLIGGWGGAGRTLASAEVFEPEGGCFWPVGGEMKHPRRLHTATRIGERRILVAGGASESEVLKSAEILQIPPEGKSGC